MVKNGRRNGRQRYKCLACGSQEQSKPRPKRLRKKLWREHVFGRQTVRQLAKKYKMGEKRVRKYFDALALAEKAHKPRKAVLPMDATFWGRKRGVFVVRDPNEKENLFWKEIESETPADYRSAREYLESIGYVAQGVVIDGKRGVREVFRDIPVQYCQFHQMKTVTRYLTRKPNTGAGQDLRAIMLSLSRTDEKTFAELLARWHKRYEEFLNERTPCSCCKPKRWPYTHRKLRAAYRSLKTNLPDLFTFQRFPDLHIPSTTNTLDGSFSRLKNQVGLHRGKTSARRYKIIQT
ncbi:hypothetical protein L0Y49_04365, partial [bacterium]|nr:hypothetical protein [bacterium]